MRWRISGGSVNNREVFWSEMEDSRDAVETEGRLEGRGSGREERTRWSSAECFCLRLFCRICSGDQPPFRTLFARDSRSEDIEGGAGIW